MLATTATSPLGVMSMPSGRRPAESDALCGLDLGALDREHHDLVVGIEGDQRALAVRGENDPAWAGLLATDGHLARGGDGRAGGW